MANSYFRAQWPYLYHYSKLGLKDDSIDKMINDFHAVCSTLSINVFESPNSESMCTVPANYVMDLVTHASTTITAFFKEREDLYQERMKDLNRQQEDLVKEQEELIKEREELIKEREYLFKYREYLRVHNDYEWETKSAHDEDCVLGRADEPAHEHDSSSEFCPGTDSPDHISESFDSEDDSLSSELREMQNSNDNYYMFNIMRALWTEVSAKRVEENESEEGDDDEDDDQEGEQQEEPEFQENPLSTSQYCNYPITGVPTAAYPAMQACNFNPLQAAPSSSTSTQNWVYPASSVQIAPRNYSPTEVSSQHTVESSIPRKRHGEQLE
ncbi:hypothetical protein N7540_000956 [Penicillium herquei]|nr:hypothetical protein N7540_000956 [Penicillium herquei]